MLIQLLAKGAPAGSHCLGATFSNFATIFCFGHLPKAKGHFTTRFSRTNSAFYGEMMLLLGGVYMPESAFVWILILVAPIGMAVVGFLCLYAVVKLFGIGFDKISLNRPPSKEKPRYRTRKPPPQGFAFALRGFSQR